MKEHSKRKWKIKRWRHFPKAWRNINSLGFHVKGKKYLVLFLFLESGRSYETAWYELAVWKYLSFLMHIYIYIWPVCYSCEKHKNRKCHRERIHLPWHRCLKVKYLSANCLPQNSYIWWKGKRYHELIICLMIKEVARGRLGRWKIGDHLGCVCLKSSEINLVYKKKKSNILHCS